MKSGKVVVFVLLTAVMVLAGCGTAPVEPSMPMATSRPKYLPTLGVTYSTPLPSDTPRPTSTVDMFDNATQSAELALTQQVFQATQAVVATMWAPFGNCYLNMNPSFISPNGEWALCDPVTIANRADNQYRLTFANLAEEPFSGEWFIGYYHWTKDGQFLYMAPIMMPDGGSGPRVFNGFMLVRIGLQNSQVQESVIAPYTFPCDNCLPNSFSFSISPTDRRLAYIDFMNMGVLNIRDLQDGSDVTIPVDSGYTDAGWFAWSMDGLYLVYYLVKSDETDCRWLESIRWLNIQNTTTVRIIDNVEVNWCDDYSHVMGDYDVIKITNTSIRFERDGIFWIFDLATGQMEEQPAP